MRELSNAYTLKHTQKNTHSTHSLLAHTMSMYHAWQDAHKQGANTVLKRCRGIKMAGQQEVGSRGTRKDYLPMQPDIRAIRDGHPLTLPDGCSSGWARRGGVLVQVLLRLQ